MFAFEVPLTPCDKVNPYHQLKIHNTITKMWRLEMYPAVGASQNLTICRRTVGNDVCKDDLMAWNLRFAPRRWFHLQAFYISQQTFESTADRATGGPANTVKGQMTFPTGASFLLVLNTKKGRTSANFPLAQ